MINKKEKVKKLLLAFDLISNLAILGFFKYFDFFIDNINFCLQKFNIGVINNPFDIILPVGISFYTFQALSYSIDVYRGDIEPERNFAKYALYVSFFPQLVAGPIERSKRLLPQIQNIEKINLWNYSKITEGAGLMLWGYFMKMVIADRLAILVDNVWDSYRTYGSCALILAAILFSIQIYCDFNSYSTIAVGASKIMGIELMQNFNTPYFSKSIKEFWRRWHISLSQWFRDYVYIPLGGSHCSVGRKYVNLLITFLLSGMWHGANWNYILWGGIHAAYQIIGDIKNKYLIKFNNFFHTKVNCVTYKIGQMIITFVFTTIAWIFFRSDSASQGFDYIVRMLTRWDFWTITQKTYLNWGLNQTELSVACVAIVILFVVDFIQYKKEMNIVQFLNTQIIVARWGIYIFLFMFIFIFGIYGPTVDSTQFIYFQF
jgi:D-alanyl-lipoteichoic acid acyltransferase DltB (MBOAT superfamily)